jgi:hypothetical protein
MEMFVNRWLFLGAGLLARLVAVAADLYSDWLLAKLHAGRRAAYHFFRDLAAFGDWVIVQLAQRWAGAADWSLS